MIWRNFLRNITSSIESWTCRSTFAHYSDTLTLAYYVISTLALNRHLDFGIGSSPRLWHWILDFRALHRHLNFAMTHRRPDFGTAGLEKARTPRHSSRGRRPISVFTKRGVAAVAVEAPQCRPTEAESNRWKERPSSGPNAKPTSLSPVYTRAAIY
ncbi:hypothetical protein KM043_005875 [Ampulex compressa]|nr:hypothetical protein KM043_005875 [Ampulex compressa]